MPTQLPRAHNQADQAIGGPQRDTIEGFDGTDLAPELLGRGDAVGGVGVAHMAQHLSSIGIAGRRHALGRAGQRAATEPLATRETDMAAILLPSPVETPPALSAVVMKPVEAGSGELDLAGTATVGVEHVVD